MHGAFICVSSVCVYIYFTKEAESFQTLDLKVLSVICTDGFTLVFLILNFFILSVLCLAMGLPYLSRWNEWWESRFRSFHYI